MRGRSGSKALPLALFLLLYFGYIAYDHSNPNKQDTPSVSRIQGAVLPARVIFVLLFLIGHSNDLPAQAPYHTSDRTSLRLGVSDAEKESLRKTSASMVSEASSWFDVSYDSLALNIDPRTTYLKGVVTIAGTCREDNSSQLTLDLNNALRVDSVRIAGVRCPFVQAPASVIVDLQRAYQSGEILSATVFYEGVPEATGFGSIVFDRHQDIPWVFTLSEPYGAKDWWPCKNDQSDKADSADILVTCDSTYKVGSEGILVSVVNNGDGTSTTHWRERYPIASYLISIAFSNYMQFSNWYRYSASDSMEILNYILPEDSAAALQVLPLVPGMLSIYDSLYGQYPFIKEKYGHSEFTFGGMEHQTMTSIGVFTENIVSHELAHQWFGDMITCRTWSDLWLHEGFAQYSTALYLERKHGMNSYWDYMNGQMNAALSAGGEVGNPDTSTAATLFYAPLVYSKGASVLHMLRHVLGDRTFFRAIYAYANDPQLRYSTATTNDLERNFESVAGKSLAYFFNEWIYGKGYPDYLYSWKWTPPALAVTVTQPSDRANPAFFTMPIDLRLTINGKDTTVILFNNALTQTFTVVCASQPTAVSLDPDGWILKREFPASEIPPAVMSLEQNYPNPFNAGTKIRYSLPKTGHVSMQIYDVLGRRVSTLVDARQASGTYEVEWAAGSLASGVYVCRLMTSEGQIEMKMMLLR